MVTVSRLCEASLAFTIFSAVAMSWFFEFSGVRLFLFDISSLVSLTLMLAAMFDTHRWAKIEWMQVRWVIVGLALLFLTEAVSILGILVDYSNEKLTQYTKYLLQRLVFTGFLCVYLLYGASVKFRHMRKHVKWFGIALIMSCLYQFLALYTYYANGNYIDEFVWPAITLGAWQPWDQDMRLGGGAVNFVFFRHGGLSQNPNQLVVQLLVFLPIIWYLRRTASVFWSVAFLIFLCALVATLSRSAFVGLIILATAYLTLTTISKGISKRKLGYLFLTIPVLTLMLPALYGYEVVESYYQILKLMVKL